MYSYGSSARVGVGKRGHGGRDYRPPPDRNKRDDGELVPPPLKACNCLIQLDIPEYLVGGASDNGNYDFAATDRRRMHWYFRGETVDERRKSMQKLTKQIRSKFGVHLEIPGRSQQGPVAIVGKSYRYTIPATAWLLQKLILTTTSGENDTPGIIQGRIQRNVKDPNDNILEGYWQQAIQHRSVDEGAIVGHLQPFWLFRSDKWSVMACDLIPSVDAESSSDAAFADDNPSKMKDNVLGQLQACIDNLQFRIGSAGLQGIDSFLHHLDENNTNLKQSMQQERAFSMAFAAGHPGKVNTLFQELSQIAIR
ncbi:hypothetical protein IV203_010699 [Nitzschia inconspicua]|uniref:Uncharacterized protein n=1 Tax=Nitzschia inconspicua TaxID=303405 RepID=A0A9K3KXV5_9STRA|nr:hypothetical protein IV203_010699 [Nitzschia inconspicua]